MRRSGLNQAMVIVNTMAEKLEQLAFAGYRKHNSDEIWSIAEAAKVLAESLNVLTATTMPPEPMPWDRGLPTPPKDLAPVEARLASVEQGLTAFRATIADIQRALGRIEGRLGSAGAPAGADELVNRIERDLLALVALDPGRLQPLLGDLEARVEALEQRRP